MAGTYSQCPQCNYEPAAPLPTTEPCPACGIYPFKWAHHLSVPPSSHERKTSWSLRTRWAGVDPIIRIKMGLMMAFLGSFASVESLASGAIFPESKGHVLSRANTPLGFWVVVLSALAFAIFGACLAVVDLMQDPPDSEVAALGINRAKTFQYLGLFCVLTVIYSIYMKGIIAGRQEVELGFSMSSLAKFCLVSAVPFGVMACSDQPWRSSDAAPVSIAAWTAVFYVFSLKYPGQCPFSAFLLFVPLVLSALLGHATGALCHQQGSA